MKYDIYVFSKVTRYGKTYWTVKVKGNKSVISEHTSQRKALNSLFNKHPKQNQFIVSLPKVLSPKEDEALMK